MLEGEEKIIRNAIKGKPLAFGMLYDHYQPKIYRFVYIKVSNREDAEDITHQAFLNAWQNIKSYKHMGFPFSSWLYSIARNLVIDHYRTKKSVVDIEEINPEFAIAPASIELSIDKGLTMDAILIAIRSLKQEYQDVLIMRFINELSLKEVAAAIGKTEGAVKLLEHRGLATIKRNIALDQTSTA